SRRLRGSGGGAPWDPALANPSTSNCTGPAANGRLLPGRAPRWPDQACRLRRASTTARTRLGARAGTQPRTSPRRDEAAQPTFQRDFAEVNATESHDTGGTAPARLQDSFRTPRWLRDLGRSSWLLV